MAPQNQAPGASVTDMLMIALGQVKQRQHARQPMEMERQQKHVPNQVESQLQQQPQPQTQQWPQQMEQQDTRRQFQLEEQQQWQQMQQQLQEQQMAMQQQQQQQKRQQQQQQLQQQQMMQQQQQQQQLPPQQTALPQQEEWTSLFTRVLGQKKAEGISLSMDMSNVVEQQGQVEQQSTQRQQMLGEQQQRLQHQLQQLQEQQMAMQEQQQHMRMMHLSMQQQQQPPQQTSLPEQEEWTSLFTRVLASKKVGQQLGQEQSSVVDNSFGAFDPFDSMRRTTLMVRNVPVMYTQEILAEEWSSWNFNFLYLPRTGAGRFNLSYAFLNFVSAVDAVEFRNQWQKKRLAHFSSKKPLNISFAEVQGLHANLARFKKKRARWQYQPTAITRVVASQ